MNILFLCTGNAARSQIAEAVARAEAPAGVNFYSAGSHPEARVHATARQVLEEAGLWRDGAHPKSVDEIPVTHWDLVITVCADADQSCPMLPGEHRRLRWPQFDPSFIPDNEERLAAFRRLREDLRARVRALFAELTAPAAAD